MIDRAARDNLAERLRHLVSGLATNYQFERGAIRSADPVISEIEFRLAWPVCDDLQEHRLTEGHAISLGHRLDFARAILFLKSNLPYEWKSHVGFRGFLNGIFRLVPLSRKSRLDASAGDLRVWPFFRKADYDAALKQAPYLHGSDQNENEKQASRLS
jgi:hypothetical protein